MAGWGACRRCGQRIWWGANPRDASRSFPFDDADESLSHFESCTAQERVTDAQGVQYQVASCKACGARVWWQTTHRGKRRPMDCDGGTATGDVHFDSCPGEPFGTQHHYRPGAATRDHGRERKTQPGHTNAPYEARLYLPDLELGWPITLPDVTSAFRRLALIHHPDMGGRAEEFIRIKLAYDRLKTIVQGVGV